MKKSKQYYNIKEVSHILNLKEHVIRHWDSIDPKTNKLRIDGLSIRTIFRSRRSFTQEIDETDCQIYFFSLIGCETSI